MKKGSKKLNNLMTLLKKCDPTTCTWLEIYRALNNQIKKEKLILCVYCNGISKPNHVCYVIKKIKELKNILVKFKLPKGQTLYDKEVKEMLLGIFQAFPKDL